MSASVEDEARARLDVAQLYEEMGQIPKAVRYYLEAAQIYKDGNVLARHKELMSKVLELEPGNATAEAAMAKLAAPPPATYTPTVRPPSTGGAAKPAAGGPQLPPLQLPTPQAGKVLTPTPWLFRDPRYVASCKKQLTTAISREVLQYDPLPKVDAQMVMVKQEQRKKAEEAARERANPHRPSAFENNRPSPFATGAPQPSGERPGLFGGGGLRPTAPPAAPSAPPAAPTEQPGSRFGGGGGRSGNQDLAEQIRRRMQERQGG